MCTKMKKTKMPQLRKNSEVVTIDFFLTSPGYAWLMTDLFLDNIDPKTFLSLEYVSPIWSDFMRDNHLWRKRLGRIRKDNSFLDQLCKEVEEEKDEEVLQSEYRRLCHVWLGYPTRKDWSGKALTVKYIGRNPSRWRAYNMVTPERLIYREDMSLLMADRVFAKGEDALDDETSRSSQDVYNLQNARTLEEYPWMTYQNDMKKILASDPSSSLAVAVPHKREEKVKIFSTNDWSQVGTIDRVGTQHVITSFKSMQLTMTSRWHAYHSEPEGTSVYKLRWEKGQIVAEEVQKIKNLISTHKVEPCGDFLMLKEPRILEQRPEQPPELKIMMRDEQGMFQDHHEYFPKAKGGEMMFHCPWTFWEPNPDLLLYTNQQNELVIFNMREKSQTKPRHKCWEKQVRCLATGGGFLVVGLRRRKENRFTVAFYSMDELIKTGRLELLRKLETSIPWYEGGRASLITRAQVLGPHLHFECHNIDAKYVLIDLWEQKRRRDKTEEEEKAKSDAY